MSKAPVLSLEPVSEVRQILKSPAVSDSKLNAGFIQRTPAAVSRISRYIPIELRRQVLEKYDYRCNFHSGDGVSAKRCSQKRFLDIDHIRPISKNGKTEFSNLHPLCSNHNRVFKQDRG